MSLTKRIVSQFERIEIVDLFENRDEIMDELFSDGFRVTHIGPYTDKKMWPKVDPSRFMLTAERQIKHEKTKTTVRAKPQ